MSSPTKFVSFRLAVPLHAELERRASVLGQSPGGLAREIVLAKLASQAADGERILELQDQLKKVRADLARATEAVLAVVGGTPESGRQAADWVKRNLNR